MNRVRYEESSPWGRVKTFIAVLGAVFAVTLALVVGNRLSAEALGVLAGAVCGVGAAIPTSLIVLAVTRRRGDLPSEHYGKMPGQPANRHAYPPVIVVSPHSAYQSGHSAWNGPPPSLSATTERTFSVVGGASTDREGRSYGNERCP